ncbi:hypothetical protein DL546_004637 [Coniochaeta pulveracea]|uniref:SWIRM domain-containing protein n=1 Tax=Coniochaeta pulveracea TaxID=177199 RepID=A0A420Y2B0_9PEZI|nr:hypothetical protein DL546_004637 [Coniochaeta pulveracea]
MTMTSSIPGVPAMASKALNISNLISPPTAVYDNFQSTMSSPPSQTMPPPAVSKESVAQQSNAPLSPPVSPYDKMLSTLNADSPRQVQAQAQSTEAPDPILYPQPTVSTPLAQQASLFLTARGTQNTRQPVHHRNEDGDASRIIDDHLRRSPLSEKARPAREDYHLVLSLQSQIIRLYEADRQGYLKRERALLAADGVARRQRQKTLLPAANTVTAYQSSSGKIGNGRVQKPARTRDSKIAKQKSTQSRAARTGASGELPTRSSAGRISATPEPRARVVAASREDKDFLSIPDYCPPLDSLPNKPNSLKVDWKAANPLDLSHDPLRHLLHPDELSLAAGLRLDGATYLTSKRRIFQSRLQCARRGKEFRKTDAQQACKIDVNKASKLWMAYDKVGWLDIRWMSSFLN